MRGSEKRIIYVRETGSRLFEEAYFVLRRGVSEGTDADGDEMVREAVRLLEASGNGYPATARRARGRRGLTVFLAGAATAASFLGGLAWVLAFL